MTDDKIDKFRNIVKESNSIVFFGGAGVSVPSGIPDFRSAKGIYSERLNDTYSPEEMVSHDFFTRHPDLFFNFYFSKLVYSDALPNKVHQVLAKWEKEGKLKAIVTQNIDGLHQMAGSKNVMELHGSVHRNYCQSCHRFFALEELDKTGIPKCPCGGVIKPDVVLYGEALDEDVIEKSVKAIAMADTLIVGGTSLMVYPAAGLIRYFHGKHLVVVNLGEQSGHFRDSYDYLLIQDDIAKVFAAVEEK
ncbi:MAG TPA: NAD-dependent protein deacylase [Bacillota bacterium]|nr:NAD-dependent protein deacylase [Bacillota bacterium]HPF41975.1 NAD-dependent protein deacylase [Bacillota bacterium]HPJ85951.1 NAD-dependent protein deacylase [Bacillota bacterium]HPQ61845.1 NAD-dependent protein deacylase [Bacillota bacterium]HRX91178.1 NAD-dependent protein deacylase [Candidatus Izemoplasmatales bacterium]